MKSTIEKLRGRPDHHKKAVAFGVSAVITLAIFGIWFSTQTFFGGPSVIAEVKNPSPLDVLQDNVASAWTGFTKIFK